MKALDYSVLSCNDPVIYGGNDGSNLRVTVIIASFNGDISQGLLDGCIKALDECNVSSRKVIQIDGSFELPLFAKTTSKDSDIVICLGSVIKGDTAHFEYVSNECARGLQRVMLETNTLVFFGVLTTYTFAQAKERSLPNDNNKGYEVGLSAVRTYNALSQSS